MMIIKLPHVKSSTESSLLRHLTRDGQNFTPPGWCKDHPYLALKSCQTMPSQVPYCALISNHPSPFSCLFKTPLTTCLFSFSLRCSDSCIPWSLWQPCLDSQPHSDHLTAHPQELFVSHSLMTCPIFVAAPSQTGPPFITHLFLSSFHSFHCLTSLMLPFKLCPVAVPHVAGHHLAPLMSSSSTIQLPSCMSPALPQLLRKPSGLLHIDCITHPHWPRAIAPHSEWATNDPHYCTDCAPAVISSFSFSTFPFFPPSTTFLPLCSLCLDYHSPSCH